MLSKSDTDIEIVSETILGAGYDVAFVVPTRTAMEKSIIDSHKSLQSFLKRSGLHDYADQPQGVKAKIQANIINADKTDVTSVSLYRPKTKEGDPRIWIYGLNKFAEPYNLIALIAIKNELFIVNCSRPKDLDAALINVLPAPELNHLLFPPCFESKSDRVYTVQSPKCPVPVQPVRIAHSNWC